MTNVVHTHGSPLNGVLQCKPELDFYIDKDMIYIADTKVAPRYGDFFVRNIQKFEEVCCDKKPSFQCALLNFVTFKLRYSHFSFVVDGYAEAH